MTNTRLGWGLLWSQWWGFSVEAMRVMGYSGGNITKVRMERDGDRGHWGKEAVGNGVGGDSVSRMFSLKNCKSLKRLPPTIGKLSSLLELYLDGSSALEEVPDSVGNLTKLEKLSLRGCGLLTSIPDSIGKLQSLIELFLNNTSIKELPASVGSLSHLKVFSVERCRSLCKLPDSIGELASLKLLWLVGTPITELPDQIGALNALEKLELGNCEKLRSLPDSIRNLLNLTTLSLDGTIIIELPQSIGMLERLDILKLNNCKYLRRLPSSIGRMTSLRYCVMKGTVVAELPEEFGMLSSLRILNMAKGKKIPDWFVPEIPSFSTQKNRDLKGVIVAVVVSLDQQQQDDFRDKVPGLVDIQLKIFRPNEPAYNDEPIHSTVLDLRGIPDTDEDHLYLCRFHDYNPFVRILKDGDKIQVAMRSPRPLFNGLELKKYGIYLVYENDDDIEDDDVESQESVTERLSKFFSSL
ncbi:Disease resistance protein TAO1 [Camellia lanceoleosa]|nr:Disease resistance protein TAO1 [Camellia lanceoleosa]